MKPDGPSLVDDATATLPPADASPSPSSLRCANCEATLTGVYCAQCGQHVADYHQSIWRFVADFFDNTFCWDNKLFRTLVPMFRQPGFLTREFMAGRRMRYVHPLRLFLFTSAICLALLHFGDPQKSTASKRRRAAANASHPATSAPDPKKPVADADEPDDDAPARPVSAVPIPVPTPAPAFPTAARSPVSTPAPASTPSAGFLSQLADAIGTPAPAAAGSPGPSAPVPSPVASPNPPATPLDPDNDATLDSAIKTAIQTRLPNEKLNVSVDLGDRLGQKFKEKVAEKGGSERFSRELVDGVRNRLSWVSLAMLPVFAFLLRALYWRKDTFYFLHLVFSLHYHTFLLLFWTTYSWLSTLLGGTFLQTLAMLLLLAPPLYLFLALRRVYGDSTRRTWLKVFLLGGMHLLAIIIGLATVGALAFFSAVQ